MGPAAAKPAVVDKSSDHTRWKGLTSTPWTVTCAPSTSPAPVSCAAEFISGGRSNLTFLVFDDASKWVLRRPPLHGLTPSAHDMAREYRVVAALHDTPVPVARAVTMRNDDSVLGAPFQMVEYVDGPRRSPHRQLEALGDKDTINDCVDALIKVLADLHSVDPEAVGLGDFGKPTGYLERQVRRWGGQWDLVRTEDDPVRCRRQATAFRSGRSDSVAEPQLDRARRLPHRQHDAGRAGRHQGARRARLGDVDPGRPDQRRRADVRVPPSDVQPDPRGCGVVIAADPVGRRTRASLLAGGRRSLDHWEFYMALAYFKLAIIAAGIAFRGREGGGVADDTDAGGRGGRPADRAGPARR